MRRADDTRAEELARLKVALATFALHLDAFEVRTHEVLLTVAKPGSVAVRRDSNRDLVNHGLARGGTRKDVVIGRQ